MLEKKLNDKIKQKSALTGVEPGYICSTSTMLCVYIIFSVHYIKKI